jgi:uncharacterized membrane protein
MAWGYDKIFTGRAALLHLGAFTATIMSANVFFIIMPNQRIVVADLQAGRSPDAKYGKIAKLRSTHNNYLTLPVIFLMLSNHYPLAFASQYNWLIAGLVFLMGVTIRHYFNTRHARAGNPTWTWPATVILFICVIWLSGLPLWQDEDLDSRVMSEQQTLFANADGYAAVHDIVVGRCSMCHAREPVYDGIRRAPKQVYLETEFDITAEARAVFLQSAASHAMPPANVTWMEEGERAQIRRWFRNATEHMPLRVALQ